MAIEAERLVAVLEARFTEFEKAVDRAQKKFAGTSTVIEQRGDALAGNIGRSAARGAVQLEKLSTAERQVRAQTGNLAAQFNDIAVSLAGGQSPFLVALQQGTQITQAFGSGTGVRGAISAVGGALLGLVNPVSLVTIGLIAAGGAALQYFMSSSDQGEEAKKALEEQEQLIQRVADKWGEAYPGIKAYADEMQRVKDLGELGQAAAVIREDKLQPGIAALEKMKATYEDLVAQLVFAGNEPETINSFTDALDAAIGKMKDGDVATRDIETAITILSTQIRQNGNPALAEMVAQMQTLISVSAGVASNIRGVFNGAAAVQEKLQNIIQASTFVDKAGNVQSPSTFTPKGDIPTPDKRPLVDLEGFPAVKGGGAKKAETNAYDSATESVKERTAALTAETDALSQVNPLIEDYGYAQEKARTEADLLSSAQKAGLEITPELRAEISQLADGYASATVASKQLAEQSQKTKAALEFQKDIASGVLSDIRSALEDGKISWQEFGDIAINVLNKIADKAQDALVDALFSGTSGSGGFSLLSLFGLGASSFKTNTTLGGFLGVGAGAPAASARVAAGLPDNLVSSASVNRLGAASLKPVSQRVDVGVGVGIDDDGKLFAKVTQIAQGQAQAVTAKGINLYRANQFHIDAAKHAARPRVRGK